MIHHVMIVYIYIYIVFFIAYHIVSSIKVQHSNHLLKLIESSIAVKSRDPFFIWI